MTETVGALTRKVARHAERRSPRPLPGVDRCSSPHPLSHVASINGISPGGWVRYARHLADAGADAIELNLYDLVVHPHHTGDAVERRYLELVEDIRAEISVPLAVLLSSYERSDPQRPRAHRGDAGLGQGVDAPAQLRQRAAASWQHESPQRGESRRVSARELLPDTAQLGECTVKLIAG
ncbi:MAG: hypothetical protein ABIR32_02590 [Ilumatobacteraceae bacterium]